MSSILNLSQNLSVNFTYSGVSLYQTIADKVAVCNASDSNAVIMVTSAFSLILLIGYTSYFLFRYRGKHFDSILDFINSHDYSNIFYHFFGLHYSIIVCLLNYQNKVIVYLSLAILGIHALFYSFSLAAKALDIVARLKRFREGNNI